MRSFSITELPLKGVRAVVFDLDGTLYDKRRLPLRLVVGDLRHVFLLAAERIARRRLRGCYYGTGEKFYKELYAQMSRLCGVSPKRAQQWYEQDYMPLMVRLLERYYKVDSFVVPLLKELRRRGILTVVFSDYGRVDDKLRALGIAPELFDFRLAAPDMGGLKPNRQLFEKMLSKVGVSANEALMVGDRDDTDGVGARAVGMRYINVNR